MYNDTFNVLTKGNKLKIQVLSTTVVTKTSGAGKPYQNCEIAYKNIDQGKVEAKNITEYSKVFKKASDATVGMFFDVTTEKDDKGYWQWTSFTPSEAVAIVPSTAPTSYKPVAQTVPAAKSTYETPEERAKKQVFIVKQSSITAALKYLEITKAKDVGVTDVLEIAQHFTDWVLEDKKTDLFSTANDLSEDGLEVI